MIVVHLQLKADQGCTETSINTSSPDLLSVIYLSVASPLFVFDEIVGMQFKNRSKILISELVVNFKWRQQVGGVEAVN